MQAPLFRQSLAEFIGTAFLLATVIGSGIMAERLAGGNVALALLCNTVPTGAILFVLITTLTPISGGHFNPAVTGVFLLRRELKPNAAAAFIAAQCGGALLGMLVAHLMFEEPLFQLSTKMRSGIPQWSSEWVATFGLVLSIFLTRRAKPSAIPAVVGLYITAAYWFTASTSFANPAVTLARSLSDTFAGIRPLDAPAFVIAQLAGAASAFYMCEFLPGPRKIRTNRRRLHKEQNMTITIYHNPDCGTSRNTLAMIRQSGEEPEIIEYLKTPPTRETLLALIAAMNTTPRALLREKGTPYGTLGSADAKWTEEELIEFMLGHPILINRPIVVTSKGVRLCRPSEVVLEILPNPKIGDFVKEDGRIVKGSRD